MSNKNDKTNAAAYYTLREAAWILGVEPGKIHRLVRLGIMRAVTRRSRLVIPAAELTRWVGGTTDAAQVRRKCRSQGGDAL